MKNKSPSNLSVVQLNDNFISFNNCWRIDKRKINAVFITRQATYRRYPILLGILFFLVALIGNFTICYIIGLIFFLCAYLIKTRYTLRIILDTGEVRPLSSVHKIELEKAKQKIEDIINNSDMDYISKELKSEIHEKNKCSYCWR